MRMKVVKEILTIDEGVREVRLVTDIYEVGSMLFTNVLRSDLEVSLKELEEIAVWQGEWVKGSDDIDGILKDSPMLTGDYEDGDSHIVSLEIYG
jgi:hypothetical protein